MRDFSLKFSVKTTNTKPIGAQMAAQMPRKTGEIAKDLNVTPNTIRNWCELYARFLSPLANPTLGNQERIFTPRDVTVLKMIAQLRAERKTHSEITQRLSETKIGEVEEVSPMGQVAPFLPGVADATGELSVHREQTPLAPLQLPAQLLEVYDSLARRLDAVEAAQRSQAQGRWDGMTMFIAGVLAAAIFFMLILFLRWVTVAG